MRKNTEFKQLNISEIRQYFYDGKIHTKNELSEASGFSLASTTNILQTLLGDGEIKQVGVATSTGGRKSKNYQLNEDFLHILQVALLKKHSKYLIKTSINNLCQKELYNDVFESEKGTLDDINKCIQRALENDSFISTIVISIPGVCKEGVVDICDYESLIKVNLKEKIKQYFDKEIIIENDVNVASIGLSSLYSTISHLSFFYQPAYDYVGCGMIIDHKLHNGFSHFAGELRYLPFYTHEDQIQLLESNPKGLLQNQMLTLISVMNPELIGYYSDVFEEEIILSTDIEDKHLPQLVRVKDYEQILSNGLFNIALKNIKERG